MTEQPHGMALQIKSELAALARRHRTPPAIPCLLPLAPPSSGPVRITGIAARYKFCTWKLPPLLYRHREPAGEITFIGHDTLGRLVISARVDLPDARRCEGLSIAATVGAFKVLDGDDPRAYRALITAATLDEVSLTPEPADLSCRVITRSPNTPVSDGFDLFQHGICKSLEIVELLRELNRRQPDPPPRRLPPRRMAVEPHRQSQFGSLVSAMGRNHAAN
jgi:hypothetical protein